MNIAHFSTEDVSGGAAKAAYRLHSALREQGRNSWMVVRNKKSDDDHVYQVPPLPSPLRHTMLNRLKERVPVLGEKPPRANYTYNFDLEPDINQRMLFTILPTRGPTRGRTRGPADGPANEPGSIDIICLHWVSRLLNARLIRRLYDHYQCPIVWTLADQDPLTGGCHYSFGCEGFTKECGCCPHLDSNDLNDHSHQTWLRKRRYFSGVPICFVAPTGWVMKRVLQSSLFGDHRVELIPYPIDTSVFRPFDQRVARDLLHLPFDKKILFFGATYLEDRRKGMKQLIEALNRLAELVESENKIKRGDLFLLVAGLNSKWLMSQLPFAGKYTGHINDEITLALAYQAADLFVCPSIEDAGPMMVPEAMLCGTPVVAFDGTGAPDLVETFKTGYLAAAADAHDLARGIYALLTSGSLEAMRAAAREASAKTHAPSLAAARHAELYQSLLGR